MCYIHTYIYIYNNHKKRTNIYIYIQTGLHDLPGLPAGVKFDPTDQEILEHLEGKVQSDDSDACAHPLIDEFIPTIRGENGICYTHPEKLPGE
jgi:hypothetical protein